MAIIGILLAAVLSFTFITSDKERVNLEGKLKDTKETLESQIRLSTAEYEAKVATLETEKFKLSNEMNERAEAEAKKKTESYAQRISDLENRLAKESDLRRAAEEDLAALKAPKTKAEAQEAKDQLLSETSKAAAAARKEKEAAVIALDTTQKVAYERANKEYNERLSALEARLEALKNGKRAIEDKWAEADGAIKRFNKAYGELSAELADTVIDDEKKAARINTEKEALKKAWEEAAKAVEKVKWAADDSSDSSAIDLAGEIDKTARSLNRAFPKLEARLPEQFKPDSKDKLGDIQLMLMQLGAMIHEAFKPEGRQMEKSEADAILLLASRIDEELRLLEAPAAVNAGPMAPSLN